MEYEFREGAHGIGNGTIITILNLYLKKTEGQNTNFPPVPTGI